MVQLLCIFSYIKDKCIAKLKIMYFRSEKKLYPDQKAFLDRILNNIHN